MTTIKATFDGKNIVPDAETAAPLRKFKRELEPGARLVMTFELASKARTRKQQGLAHELMGRYARKMGESLEQVKIKAKADLGYYVDAKPILDGDEPMPPWRGRFVDLCYVYPHKPPLSIVVLQSEADYTTRQEKELIDFLLQMCNANGVRVQDILDTLDAQ